MSKQRKKYERRVPRREVREDARETFEEVYEKKKATVSSFQEKWQKNVKNTPQRRQGYI